jgi:Ca2+-binding RTX toxin-like protein
LLEVIANLSTGTGGGDGLSYSDGDVYSGIENIIGGKVDDILTGDAGVNIIDGDMGDDTIRGWCWS